MIWSTVPQPGLTPESRPVEQKPVLLVAATTVASAAASSIHIHIRLLCLAADAGYINTMIS